MPSAMSPLTPGIAGGKHGAHAQQRLRTMSAFKVKSQGDFRMLKTKA